MFGSSPDAGRPCSWSDGGTVCPPGEYCFAPGCGAGDCRPIPPMGSVSGSKAPECGCDRVSWWNGEVAAAHGMSTFRTGTCSTGARNCGGISGAQCPSGRYCQYQVGDALGCSTVDLGGSCWGMPANCPTGVVPPQRKGCLGKTCTNECDLIKLQIASYPDQICPQ